MHKTNQGKFITFEGGEGSGKSTQSKMLYQYLTSKNIKTILTREIGGTPEAEKMRELLMHQDLLPMSELLQVMAARYEHINKKIIPALTEGYIVLCDRFVDSTACYQGQYEEIGMDLVYDLHKSLMYNLMPDITFLIDVRPDIAIARTYGRPDNNKFDQRGPEFQQKIHDMFQNVAIRFLERVVSIEASLLSVEQVHSIIRGKIEDLIL